MLTKRNAGKYLDGKYAEERARCAYNSLLFNDDQKEFLEVGDTDKGQPAGNDYQSFDEMKEETGSLEYTPTEPYNRRTPFSKDVADQGRTKGDKIDK